MRDIGSSGVKAAVAAATLGLLAWPSPAGPGTGRTGDVTISVSGLVSFELDPGVRRISPGDALAPEPALASAFESLHVTNVKPYFSRPSRAPLTDEEERLSRIYQAEYGSDTPPAEAAALLLASPAVLAASAVPLRELAGLPDDARFAEQWGFRQTSDFDMDLPEAWDVFRGDSTAVIAVLDTGLDRLHPDLGGTSPDSPGNVWVNPVEAGGAAGVDDDANGYIDDVWGWDWVHYEYDPQEDDPPWPGEDYLDEDCVPADFHGHGTGVAGVVGAVGNNGLGVAGYLWRCRVMGLRCGLAIQTGGSSPAGAVRMDWCARAVTYATDMGAAAMNASWESGYDVGLEAAVDYAVSRGVVVTVAAGNRGVDPADLAARNYLSSRGDCVDVAAVQENGRRRYDSNFGAWVDLSAPGSNVLTLKFVYPDFRGYGLWSGTSFAAPAVAAAAALVKRDHPDWSAEQVRFHLQASSVPLSPADPTIGAGLMNAFAAIRPPDGGWSLKLGSEVSTAVLPVAGRGGVSALAAGLRDGRAAAWTPAGENLDSWPVALGGGALSGVAVGDCDGDGEPELVFVDDSGSVAVLGLSGSVLSRWNGGAAPAGGPVLADLTGDGTLQVLLAAADSTVRAWTLTGVPLPGWPVALPAAAAGPPAAADVCGDEGAEVVVACADGSVHCLSAEGYEGSGWPVSAGVALSKPPSLGDIAGEDGVPEVLVGGDDGRLYAWNGGGTTVEGWPFGAAAGPLSAGLSLGDADRDGKIEAAAAAGNRELCLMDVRGYAEAGWPVSVGLGGSAVLMADVSGDSVPDLLATVSGVGLGAWDIGGSKLDNWPKPSDGSPLGAIAIGDFDGDGRPEAICAATGGWLHCWDLGSVVYVHSAALWPLPGRTPGNTRLAALSVPADTLGGGQGLGEPAPFRVVALYASPNPAKAGATIVSELAGPSGVQRPARLRIFDAAGRLVREIRLPPRSPGVYRDYWDGKRDDGLRAPSGVYFCAAAVDGPPRSCAIVLVR